MAVDRLVFSAMASKGSLSIYLFTMMFFISWFFILLIFFWMCCSRVSIFAISLESSRDRAFLRPWIFLRDNMASFEAAFSRGVSRFCFRLFFICILLLVFGCYVFRRVSEQCWGDCGSSLQ